MTSLIPKSKRVLIADDEPVMRRLLTSMLERDGYVPVEVNNGREAFKMLQTDSDFTAAVFDMKMPCLTGLDLLRYMQTEKRLQRIPVMLITAETHLKLMSDSLAAGATAFLPKTFTREQLESSVRLLLGANKR